MINRRNTNPSEVGFQIANPMGTNTADPTNLWQVMHRPANVSKTADIFAITMSSRLIMNALPTKLGSGCVMQVARQLALQELDTNAISERMGSSNFMLDGICKAITSPGEYQLDAVWASWVLVVYLCCHPEGRVLLRGTALTDVDYQTATAFEAYGRAEITRRTRLEQQQQTSGRKRRSPEPPATPASGPSNEGAGSAAEDLPDVVMNELEAEEQRVLGTKKKRGQKGCASASTSDSAGMLTWWFHALRCDNASVLLSLVAHSKQAAKDAACQTLEKQAEGATSVSQNVVIRGISEQNAEASAKALVPFVGRKAMEMPALMLWKWNGRSYRGITRIHNEAQSTTMHACVLASQVMQPLKETRLAVAWSVASIQFAPKTEECNNLPSILERLRGAVRQREQGKRGEMVASRVEAMTLGEAESPRPTQLSGITRSTLSMEIILSTSQSEVTIGESLGKELANLSAVRVCQTGGMPILQNIEQDPTTRREPLCTPATRLALGIALNEELRTWMMGKSRKGDPCKVALGTMTSQERSQNVPSIVNSEPPPLLTIVDINLELTDQGAEDLYSWGENAHRHLPYEEAKVACDIEFGLALHVCGDSAVRVPEMLRVLRKELNEVDFVAQARATLWAAMSQASYLSDVGPTISAGYANTAISASKKISVADNHRLALLSPFDVYASGIMNVEPSQVGTPYVGTYGCCFDHGISPPGTFFMQPCAVTTLYTVHRTPYTLC